jgi:hypothetical protein
VFLSGFASAQTNQKDIIYLKNGSIIKGTIIEIIPDSTLKIQTADGSLFIYKTKDVEKITKEEVKKPEVKQQAVKTETVKSEKHILAPKGYFVLARLGPNVQLFEGIEVSMGIINGYHVNEFFSLGVGIEATHYNFDYNNYLSAPLYPIFVDARFQIPKGIVSPMFSMQFGYAALGKITSTNNVNYNTSEVGGGLYVAVGAGLKVTINKTFAFLAEGGASFQSIKGYIDNFDYYNNSGNFYSSGTEETVPSLRVNIGFAVSFGK